MPKPNQLKWFESVAIFQTKSLIIIIWTMSTIPTNQKDGPFL